MASDWDFGKIKAVLKSLRITKSVECLPFVMERLEELLPFAKEIALLLDTIKTSGAQIKTEYCQKILAVSKVPAARMVPTIHAWLLEVFVRGVFRPTQKELNEIVATNPIIERQTYLIRGLNADVNFFRRNKTRFDAISPYAKHAFILGATCLPKGEFEAWIGAIRSRMNGPLDAQYLDWAKSKLGSLPELLSMRVEEEA